MIVLDNDQESFVRAYLEKQTGEQTPKGLKAFSGYLEALDKAFYKRMMTAYRVDKKRRLDKEAGNASVNVVLSKNAHARLKAMADSHGVTLSNFVEHQMNDGLIVGDQDLQTENDNLKEQVKLLDFYKSELEQLRADYKNELEQLQSELAKVKKLNTSLKRENKKLNAENEQLKADVTNEKAASATLLRRTKKALEKNGVTL